MKINFLRTEFLSQLKKDYPEREILSFFSLLTEKYLNKSRLQLALQPELSLETEDEIRFKNALKRLKKNEPIQYILGETYFFGLNFKVNENVLIPRPETEELVQWILEDYGEPDFENLQILDIGTGSGCIAISLAKNLPGAKITAMDISEEALKTAQENAFLNNVSVNFIHQDILKLEKLDTEFDIIISNPPYVKNLEKNSMHSNVLLYEPETALFVEDEGPLLFYEKITFLAEKSLSEAGNLYFEINQYLSDETRKLVEKYNFDSELRKDIFNNFRMLKATRKKNLKA